MVYEWARTRPKEASSHTRCLGEPAEWLGELGWGNIFVVPTRVLQGGRAGCVFVEEVSVGSELGI